MADNIKDLTNRKLQVWHEMNGIIERAEGKPLAAEDTAKYEEMETELRSLTATIETKRRHAELENTMNTVSDAAKGAASEAGDDPKAAYRAAFGEYLLRGQSLDAEKRSELEKRAHAAGIDTDGGFLVPDEAQAAIIETLKAFGGIRSLAATINTASGADLLMPTHDGTSNLGEIVDENTAVANLTDTFGQKRLKSYMYSSKMIKASRQFVQDANINAAGSIGAWAAERIARIQAQHWITGTNVNQPEGITKATSDNTLASATTVTYAELVDIVHALDPAYRRMRGTAWVFSDATAGEIRKLTDTTNRPLWVPDTNTPAGIAGAEPGTLLGFPVVIDQDVPDMASSAKSIFFGNFAKAYLIRDVGAMQMLRLEERFAELLQLGFLGFIRSDGTVVDSTAYVQAENAA